MKKNLLIKGKYLLTMDDELSVIEDGGVIVEDDVIVKTGKSADLEKEFTGKIYDTGNSIIMPGLINTHTHVAMTYFRGMADDLPLKEWLEKHIWPAEAKYMNPDFVKNSASLGCLEMIKSGTTCFNNMSFFEDIISKVVEKSYMRAFLGEGLLMFPTPSCSTPDMAIEKTIELIKEHSENELIKICFAPHSIYTCEKKYLYKVKELSEEYKVPLHIHVSETKEEVKDSKKNHKQSPVAYLDKLNFLDKNVLSAHNIWISEKDMDIYKKRSVRLSHCPISNLKLASGVAPISRLLEKGIVVSLGTDSAASNNTLDLFSEIKTCALIQKAYNLDPTVLPAKTVVEMATKNGAKALGVDDIIGSLESGKKADIITIDLDKPHLSPIYDPYSHIVYCANSSDVANVFVNGKQIVKNSEVLTMNEERILHDANNFKIEK